MANHGQSGVETIQYNFIATADDLSAMDDLGRLTRELELLKNAVSGFFTYISPPPPRFFMLATHQIYFDAMFLDSQNPYRMAEMALELQIERLRVAEITNARDAALHRLSDAYAHITEKNALIEKFQAERDGADGIAGTGLLKSEFDPQAATVEVDSLTAHIHTLESTTEGLRAEIVELNLKLAECPPPSSPLVSPSPSSPPSYTENSLTKVTGLLREFCVWRLNSFVQPERLDVSTETQFPTKVDAGVATKFDNNIEQTVCSIICCVERDN